MRKVLIISPHFAPTNAPDMQRVRLALPYLRACGWEPVVLAVHPDSIEGGVNDPLLIQTYPADVRVIRVRGIPARLTRWARVGSLWLRCACALRTEGERLLRTERFDLVFFSTTQFGAFTLGPRWKRQFGVPYVLDYQDPWVNDHYQKTGEAPPGGPLKYAIAQWHARRREPAVVRAAAAIIAVSPAYVLDLNTRYPRHAPTAFHVIPFGAAEADIALARHHKPAAPLVPFGDGNTHLVYTGRGGADMTTALTLIFRAFKRFRSSHPKEAARMRFHFIGTSYAPPPLGEASVLPVAQAEGMAEVVNEHCRRVPYFDALHYLAQADAVIALGSNDPGYSASKIFPCILARKPLLAVFHRDSPVHGLMQAVGLASYGFAPEGINEAAVEQIATQWFASVHQRCAPEVTPEAVRPFTAAAMTESMVKCFNQAVHHA